MTAQRLPEYSFSYVVDSFVHSLNEEPIVVSGGETVPLAVFANEQSPLQALCRYLVDVRKKSYSDVARLLGRSPKTIWASHHQALPLPTIDENTLRIPLSIFSTPLSPLESIVTYLRERGLRNSEIAAAINRDPRTTWTVAKRGEGKR